jgi:hypothetical protein
MLPWKRAKPLIGVGVVVAAALTWVLAFRTGWADGDWNQEWHAPSDTRGKSVYIGNKDVETAIEKEKRLAKDKTIRQEAGSMKRSLLGDRRKLLGEDIVPETPDLPEGFEFNPREACMQMKMEFPERYGKVDCSNDKFNGDDPWWKRPQHGF